MECPYPNCATFLESNLRSHLAKHMGYHRQVCYSCEFKCYDARDMFEHGKTRKHKIGINAVSSFCWVCSLSA